jgi:hypothetical protein
MFVHGFRRWHSAMQTSTSSSTDNMFLRLRAVMLLIVLLECLIARQQVTVATGQRMSS